MDLSRSQTDVLLFAVVRGSSVVLLDDVRGSSVEGRHQDGVDEDRGTIALQRSFL